MYDWCLESEGRIWIAPRLFISNLKSIFHVNQLNGVVIQKLYFFGIPHNLVYPTAAVVPIAINRDIVCPFTTFSEEEKAMCCQRLLLYHLPSIATNVQWSVYGTYIKKKHKKFGGGRQNSPIWAGREIRGHLFSSERLTKGHTTTLLRNFATPYVSPH